MLGQPSLRALVWTVWGPVTNSPEQDPRHILHSPHPLYPVHHLQCPRRPHSLHLEHLIQSGVPKFVHLIQKFVIGQY